MLGEFKFENILFLDIETVPICATYDELPEEYKNFWEKKSGFFKNKNQSAEDVYPRAGIYAEFGKIVCISVGYLYMEDDNKCFRIKSFFGHDEKDFLPQFIAMVDDFVKKKEVQLCAHNGKEFDFPYLARRILINGYKLPKVLRIAGKKPWEINHIDTMELWKFGDYKHFTSLNLLSHLFNIPTSKDDIDGSMVAQVYYEDNDLDRIVKYCEKDVLAVAQLLLKYNNEELIDPENIISASSEGNSG